MKTLGRQNKKSFPFAESFLSEFKKNRVVFVYPFHKRKTFYPNFFPLEQNSHLPPFYFLSLSVPSQFRKKEIKFLFPHTLSPKMWRVGERGNLSKVKKQ